MNIIRYDELTYPEIAALPRKLSFVIPLGNAPKPDVLARALKRELGCIPDQVVMLPPLPPGWNVSPAILRRFLSTLRASLRAQGFRKISPQSGPSQTSTRNLKSRRSPRVREISNLKTQAGQNSQTCRAQTADQTQVI